jgi:iron complex outermembrane receptor protein
MANIRHQNHPSSSAFTGHMGLILFACAAVAGMSLPNAVAAQEEAASPTTSVMLEEIIVTSRKREEPLQDVPLSVSAYTADQIDRLKIRKLDDVTVGLPNVAMDDIGTFRSVQNFSIRGLGINSSIPSIDPTVGVFVDGVYLGINQGVVIDMFDVASIEVLRGPQGILFGRNVTGGAVLINTKRPTEEVEVRVKAAVDANPNGDGGLNKYAMGSISGPLGDQFGFRLSAYQNQDNGWFVNLYDGEDFGKARTTIIRPVLSWQPSDEVRIVVRYEYTESTGDGPASQTHTNGSGVSGSFVNFERDSFDFSIDEPGFADFENDLLTAQIDWDVAFGDGTITNIFGWKDYTSTSLSDIDAQPVWLFHAPAGLNAEQFSDELRYNGTFGNAKVTAGLYWFSNEVNYAEQRNLLGIATGNVRPALTQSGGGNQWTDSYAGFAAVDYYLNEKWTLLTGIRYTVEDKNVEIASLIRNVNMPCNVIEGTCPYDFISDDSWNAWSGKLGATYEISGDKRMYGHWSRSHRSGGYNLRNTATDTVNLGPGPFDQETVDNYELGYKSELGGRGYFNAAVFYLVVSDMQREINLSDPFSGVVQLIKNTADTETWGFELEGTFSLGYDTVLTASLGWIDPQYTEIFFDLNGDTVIDDKDLDLKLPRAAEWTPAIGLTNDLELGGWGWMTSRVSYAYRDESFFTDNNRGWLLSQHILDAGLDFRTADDRWVFSIYGNNLLNSVSHGGDTQLPRFLGPVPVGGTFSPLAKGRVLGVEVGFNY